MLQSRVSVEVQAATEAKHHCQVAFEEKDKAAITVSLSNLQPLPLQVPGGAPSQSGLLATATTSAMLGAAASGLPACRSGGEITAEFLGVM